MVQAKTKERNRIIDLIKGIAIVMMVGGHCSMPGSHFVYLFHMSIFIVASGYFFKYTNSDSFKNLFKYLKRRIKGLWIPYVSCTIIFSILHNFFLNINIYTNNKAIYNEVPAAYVKITNYWSIKDSIKIIIQSCFMYKWTGSELLGAFWFIETLFKISLLFCLLDLIMKKVFKLKKTYIPQLVISLAFLAIGFWSHIHSFDFYGTGLHRVFSFYILFYLGYVVSTLNVMNILYKSKRGIIYILGSLAVLLVLNQMGTVDLIDNKYVNPAFLLVASSSGWVLMYGACYYIDKCNILSRPISYLGRNSIYIVALNYLSFKIVSYIGLMIDGRPDYCLAAFPVLYTKGFWWIPYMLVGVLIPIGIGTIWNKIKATIKNKALA